MKTSKTTTVTAETTENLAPLDRAEQALAKAIANKQAADAELDAKTAEIDRLDAELEAELNADPNDPDEPKTILMACDRACDKCGDCPDRQPQTVDEDDEDLIALLSEPCDCETLNTEVKHVRVATETKAA
jgi:DNA repair ATPase RecN